MVCKMLTPWFIFKNITWLTVYLYLTRILIWICWHILAPRAESWSVASSSSGEALVTWCAEYWSSSSFGGPFSARYTFIYHIYNLFLCVLIFVFCVCYFCSLALCSYLLLACCSCCEGRILAEYEQSRVLILFFIWRPIISTVYIYLPYP